jgi:hypothetical protein
MKMEFIVRFLPDFLPDYLPDFLPDFLPEKYFTGIFTSLAGWTRCCCNQFYTQSRQGRHAASWVAERSNSTAY